MKQKNFKDMIKEMRDPDIIYPKRDITIEEIANLLLHEINNILVHFGNTTKDETFNDLYHIIEKKLDTIQEMLTRTNYDYWEEFNKKMKIESKENK